jgi:DNA-binding NarL/FixJ family response regulator
MIYLVEDNDALRSSLIAMLTEGAQLSVCGWSSTEQEATEWLRQHRSQWRLAVVDLFLLQGSGLGVVSQLREREPWQKIVLLTNYATPDIRRRALALGADAVFDKGKELEVFLDYCRDLASLSPGPSTLHPE